MIAATVSDCILIYLILAPFLFVSREKKLFHMFLSGVFEKIVERLKEKGSESVQKR